MFVDQGLCRQRRYRTTNNVEGWHLKINYNLLKPNPRVTDVIYCLIKETETKKNLV